MAYRVLVSGPAEASLDEAVGYIAMRLSAPLAASNLLDAYGEPLRDIAEHPLAHGVVTEYRAATGLDVRRRLVKRYELDYYVDEEKEGGLRRRLPPRPAGSGPTPAGQPGLTAAGG